MKPGPRTITACAMFGLDAAEAAESPAPVDPAAADRVVSIADSDAGRVVFLTGPSGTGKTTLLGAIESRWGDRAVIRPVRRLPARPIAELSARDPLEVWLGALARAGLAEARLFARTPGELSEGQRARLGVAMAMRRAERASKPALLLLDEFGSTLDRMTADALARTTARWARSTPGLLCVCSTARGELARPIDADLTIRLDFGARASFIERRGRAR